MAQRGVVDGDARVVEQAQHGAQRGGAGGGGQGDLLAVAAGARRRLAQRRDDLDGTVALAGVGDAELDQVSAQVCLELAGGALGDEPAVVDDGDVVGEPVSRSLLM